MNGANINLDTEDGQKQYVRKRILELMGEGHSKEDAIMQTLDIVQEIIRNSKDGFLLSGTDIDDVVEEIKKTVKSGISNISRGGARRKAGRKTRRVRRGRRATHKRK